LHGRCGQRHAGTACGGTQQPLRQDGGAPQTYMVSGSGPEGGKKEGRFTIGGGWGAVEEPPSAD